MLFKNKKTLSIDFDTRSVKIVEASFKKDRLNIYDTFTIDLPEGTYEDGYIIDPGLLRDTLDSFLRLNEVKREDASVVLNSTDILTREIVLPNVTDEEVDGILKYQINDYIPIDVDEYVVQYLDQGVFMEEGNEKRKLFISAMPKEIVVSFLDLLADLDFKPKVLDFKSNAIRKLVDYNIDSIGKETVAVVDIGYTNTSLSILKEGYIEVSRTLILGIREVLDRGELNSSEEERMEELLSLEESDIVKEGLENSLEDFLRSLFEQLDMVFRYYNSAEVNNSIDLIFVQGDIVKLKKVEEMFEEYLSIETTSIDSLDEEMEEELYLYGTAIGAILRGGRKWKI